MKKFHMVLASIVMIIALAAPTAFAHTANPDFHSEIEPLPQAGSTDGVVISITPGSDHVRLENDSGKTVTVLGTEGEPYIRILPNGDVQVNENSATFKEDEKMEAAEEAEEAAGGENHTHEDGAGGDHHADDGKSDGGKGDSGKSDDHADEGAGHEHPEGTPPHDDSGTPPHEHPEGTPPHEHEDGSTDASDDKSGEKPAAGESGQSGPNWQTVDDVEKGAYEWRDQRVRYLGEGVPPQVTDESKETLIKTYEIPLQVAGETVEAKGELTWKGDEDTSSTLPFIGLGVLALAAIGGAILISRRRKREGDDAAGEGSTGGDAPAS